MSCFTEKLKTAPEYSTVLKGIFSGRLPMGVLGLSHIHKANFTAALCEDTGKSALVITPDESQATRLVQDLTAMGVTCAVYPARDFVFRTTEGHSREYEHIRLGILSHMSDGDYDVVVASVEAAMQLTMPIEELDRHSFTITAGDEVKIDVLSHRLIAAGYSRAQQVDGVGQFAVRGGIIDIFSPNRPKPSRIELWGDTVDSIADFDLASQRRTENLQSLRIIPAAEVIFDDGSLSDFLENFYLTIKGKGSVKAKSVLRDEIEKINSGMTLSSLDRFMPLIYKRPSTLFDYISGGMLLVSESFSVSERAKACEELLYEDIKLLLEEGFITRGLDRFALTRNELIDIYNSVGAVYLDNLTRGSFDTPVKELVTVTARQISPWNGSFALLLDDLSSYKGKGDWTIAITAGTEKAASALSSDLVAEGFNSMFLPVMPKNLPAGIICILPGTLSSGYEYPNQRFTVMTYGARYAMPSRQKKKSVSKKNAFNSLEELHKGDYIVHTIHGIGIFDGITKLEAGGTVKDYIKIKYSKGDILYLPVAQLDQVSKYIGPNSNGTVKLNRLGGKEWQKTKNKVSSAVRDMAQELITLYSRRMALSGHAFSPDIDMQSDFERRFEFDETEDQLRCINEVKADMEKPCPMDRLLCGDVGFGKTEVALRGAFKCVADGKQCAVLVPTTILALQHYQTIKRRFEGFPIEAAMLSRFSSAKEITSTIEALRRGTVDIVVGTHRMISKDVKFKDLGLIIIDEEQRFGVAQKEKLKELYPTVDVLTMTATPIPRTLNMSMSGIRDMSVLEEAPQDRRPVQTYVIEHDMEVLVQAMTAELRRGGQVYYLHNKVDSIEHCAAQIKELLPDARVAIAHGQMHEDKLSEIWRSLLEGEIDILVCTTIIETGIDVPNVNTLIIEDADKLGLAQLHQIRGRVGRSARRANAYLTFKKNKELSEIATRRLEAIREYTEFGSGFKIAMQDMELRGAGNLLGAQQHGHMEAVGYDMYMKLLQQAISEEKGEPVETGSEKECLIDLPIDAYIPPEYISSVPHKISMYRRIADIRTREDAEDVIDELVDRFGEPPESVLGLITVSLLRGIAIRHGIYEIGKKADRLALYIDDLDMKKITLLAQKLPGRISVNASGKPHIAVTVRGGENQLELLKKVFDYLDENSIET